jgi:hypothetical protein
MTGDLSPSDCAELQELWLGPNPNLGSLFADRQELREAWEQHRVEVMALFAKDGRRPMGWWEFEAPGLGLKYPDDARAILPVRADRRPSRGRACRAFALLA